jgi:ATP-binding cassette subfamily B protein
MNDLSTARMCWRLLRNEPVAYALSWLLWVCFHSAPVAVGWMVKVILDRLTNDSTATPWMLLGVLAGIEIGRWLLFAVAAVQWHGMWLGWLTLPRQNMLRSLTSGDGPVDDRLPGSPGEAVSRFRDDTEDVGMVLDVWLDISGSLLSALIAFVVIASIDVTAAIAVVVPVGIALAIALAFGPRLRRWREQSREAAGVVTGFIGDTFGSVLAVKTAGAESATTAQFARHNSHRANLALRDQVGSEFVRSLGYGTAEVAVGVVLLFVASAISSGDLTAGDVALFASYVTVIAGLAKWSGRVATFHLQADVSAKRLARLTADRSHAAVVTHGDMHLRHGPPPLSGEAAPPAPLPALVELRTRSLTARYGSAQRGIAGVDLEVRAGELVVVTGAVGSGKTTLLRALLGLAATQDGTVEWNGRVVDPALQLVPPAVAYIPQVPRLFSEALADTVLLGLDPMHLRDALWQACMEDDVSRMHDGVSTVVGPKGVRLSGGQIQRTGAARAFVRRPQLLVVDDLSSALDVETEQLLWQRFRENPSGVVGTALVVSHREHVLDLADRVVVIDNGRITG